MTSTTIPRLTPALAEYIRDLTTKTRDPGLPGIPIGPGRVASRNASRASSIGVAKQYDHNGVVCTSFGSYISLLPLAADALKQFDQGQLPQGVAIGTDLRIASRRKELGCLRKSGAGRGATVVWSAFDAADNSLGTFSGDGARVRAIRAVCKAAGIELPGE